MYILHITDNYIKNQSQSVDVFSLKGGIIFFLN